LFRYNEYKFGYEPFYVGKGFKSRYKNYKHRNKSCSQFLKEIKNEYLEPLVLITFYDSDEDKAYEKEIELIKTIGKKRKENSDKSLK